MGGRGMEREKVGKALSWLVTHLVGVVEGALLVAWTGSNRFLLGLAGCHGSQRGGHASTSPSLHAPGID